MDNNENKISKKNLIFMIFTIVAVLMAGTFAWLSYRTQDTAMVLTVGDIENVRVVLSPYQINSSIGSVTSYTSGAVTNVEAVNNNTSSKKFKLYYKVDSIDSNLAITSFKYTITRSTSKNGTYSKYGSDGNFSGVKSGDSVVILEENLSAGQTYYYKVYLWLDGSGNVSSAQGKSFVGELRAEIISLSDQYQQVEYIESTGTQYINTEYYPNKDTGIYADFQFTALTVQQRLFGADSSSSSVAMSYSFYINGSNCWAYAYNDGVGNWKSTSVSVNTNRHTLSINPISKKVIIDSGSAYNSALAGTVTKVSDYPMPVLARNNLGTISNYANAKLYEFIIYENGEKKMHFVPCYDKYNLLSTGKYDSGLCDIINNKFYGNSGTGYFNYGNNV